MNAVTYPRYAALTIVVIDDNPQMRTIIGTILSAIGVRRIYYAADGRRGLQAVHSSAPDIVFVDLEMPVMNGIEFITSVRDLQPPLRYLPIIMLTGHSFGPSVFRARDAGVNEFLTKPVSAKTILERLHQVIYRPRPFVLSKHYRGPDRRRRAIAEYRGPKRRSADLADRIEI